MAGTTNIDSSGAVTMPPTISSAMRCSSIERPTKPSSPARRALSIGCKNSSGATGASLPLTAMVDQYYADVQAMGGNRWDTSSLKARLKP